MAGGGAPEEEEALRTDPGTPHQRGPSTASPSCANPGQPVLSGGNKSVYNVGKTATKSPNPGLPPRFVRAGGSPRAGYLLWCLHVEVLALSQRGTQGREWDF